MSTPIETDVVTVKSLLDAGADMLLLDCRGDDEYAIAHIDASRLIPMPELPQRLSELADSADRPVVVYCHLGARSLMVAEWLRQQGFPQAQSMAGGIDAWSTQIDPTLPRY